VLFIVGGAFAGLDKVIEQRIGKKAIGFGRCCTPSTRSTP
jgi:ATP-dependent Clp protease ATP-binding subunit ClpX